MEQTPAKDLEAWQLYSRAAQSTDLQVVTALSNQARALFNQEPACKPGLVAVAFTLGLVALVQKHPEEAASLFQEGADFWQAQPPSPPAATCFTQLGVARGQLGQNAAALDAYRRALTISRELNDVPGIIDRDLDVGLTQAVLEHSADGVKSLDEAVLLAERQNDTVRLCRALDRRAYVRMLHQADYVAARKDWLRITEIGPPADRAMAWMQVSGTYLVQDRTADGMSAVEKALALTRESGPPNEVALCLMRLADLQAADQPAKAEGVYEEAANTFHAEGNLELEIQARTQRAALAWRQGHLEDAIARYMLSLDTAEAGGMHLEAAMCCGALATIHQALKHPTEAEKYMHRAADQWALVPDQSGAVEHVIAQAQSAARQDRTKEAIDKLEAQLAAFESHPDPSLMVRLHQACADIAMGSGAISTAVTHAEAALHIYESLDMSQMRVTSGINLASIYVAAAEAAQRNALAVAVEKKLPDLIRDAKVALAKTLFDSSHYEKARAELRAALSAGGHHNPFLESSIHVGLSVVADRLADDQNAFQELQRAAKLLDAFRLDFAMPDLAAGFVGSLTNIYGQLVRAALRSPGPGVAFDYVEQSRSRAMLRLTGFTELPVPASISPKLASRERVSLHESEQALARLHANGEDAKSLKDLRSAYQRLEAVWRAMGASEYVALRRGDASTYQETRDGLASEAKRVVLVEYFCRDNTTLVFGVRPESDEPDVVTLQLSQPDLSRFVRRNFGKRDPTHLADPEAQRQWQSFDFLVAAIARWAEAGDLIYLVPHQLLHYLPLHSLSLEGRPLAERNPVMYSPSASVLQYCRAKRMKRREPPKAAVFGDSMNNLKYSRREAMEVAKALYAKPLLGGEVTKAAVRQAVQNADIVHFAGHAYFDARSPLHSGVVMADDVLLTARDVFGLEQFRADLVVLSGCQTGISDVQPGDELMGLTRAFLAAGTRSLMVSMWRVADESTAFLMNRFYSCLLGSPSRTKAEALQQAILDTRSQPGWDSFYNWAPFILVGDWQ